MAYLASQLITRAWYRSMVVARNNQSITGDQMTEGLALLNEILEFQNIDHDLIPFWTYNTSISTIANQENYFIPNCYAIESVTFNISTVRYPMDSISRRTYYASARVDDIASLPFSYYFNRSKGGGNLALYFLPSDVFPLKIMMKQGLNDVTLTTDMSLVYEGNYISYLIFYLARYMCAEYGLTMSQESAAIYKSLTRKLMYVSPPDLSMKKGSILQSDQSGINYGDVNIGMGYRPR